MKSKGWNTHYGRDKSILSYPDENLVRMLSKNTGKSDNPEKLRAVDIGTGSGRHLDLLQNFGFGEVYGSDYSIEGLNVCRERGFTNLVNCENINMPFRDSSFNTAVAWGSLHYSDKKDLRIMVSEILRVLEEGGNLYATLRSHRDTYLRRGKHIGENTWTTGIDDLSGTTVSFYDEDELREYFSDFSFLEYGWMERTIMGDTSKIISHWVLHAVK